MKKILCLYYNYQNDSQKPAVTAKCFGPIVHLYCIAYFYFQQNGAYINFLTQLVKTYQLEAKIRGLSPTGSEFLGHVRNIRNNQDTQRNTRIHNRIGYIT